MFSLRRKKIFNLVSIGSQFSSLNVKTAKEKKKTVTTLKSIGSLGLKKKTWLSDFMRL